MEINQEETMMKEDKTRLCVQYDDHSTVLCTVLCSLMERQSLVDLAIRCGTNTMHAHKCILAASSPFFREQLEQNPGTELVIINGLDFDIMKAVIEFIYCGEMVILEENLKYVVAAAKLFQIRGLQALASQTQFKSDETIIIPPPIFINKNYSENPPSLLPLPPQQLAPASKHDEAFTNDIDDVPEPLQVVIYGGEMNGPTVAPPTEDNGAGGGAEKNAFPQEMQTNVEIMYKTAEGEYVQVTDEVLRNIPGDSLQFEVIDEHGRELQLLGEKFKSRPPDSCNQFFNVAFKEDESDLESVDLDSILASFQNQNNNELEGGPDDNMPLLGGGIGGGDNPMLDYDDTTDILDEINSMQFYDNSVYEDMAERIESAYQHQNDASFIPQENEMHVTDADHRLNDPPEFSILENRSDNYFY